MTEQSRFERRIAVLIGEYADGAPTDVDPMAIARVAASTRSVRPALARGFAPAGLRFGFAIAVLALSATIVGIVLVPGRYNALPQQSVDVPADRPIVAPFVGLPPIGAAPSKPRTGELVLGFSARVRSTGLTFNRLWVYEDGRMIWIQELRTKGVYEQHLSSKGIKLLINEVVSSAEEIGPSSTDRWGLPGALWGGVRVKVGSELVGVEWTSEKLPGRLSDPMAWLPDDAWSDARIGAYVPSRYAVCFGPVGADLDDLSPLVPSATTTLLRELGAPFAIIAIDRGLTCPYSVTTDGAREVAASLEDAGMTGDAGALRYYLPAGVAYAREEGWIELLMILPNGELVCNCG